MNYLDGYVEEVLSEPYYDDYGSGVFRWWVKVSYVCEGIGAVTTLMFDTREEAEAVKTGYKFYSALHPTGSYNAHANTYAYIHNPSPLRDGSS